MALQAFRGSVITWQRDSGRRDADSLRFLNKILSTLFGKLIAAMQQEVPILRRTRV
jgi:hypothetical protein